MKHSVLIPVTWASLVAASMAYAETNELPAAFGEIKQSVRTAGAASPANVRRHRAAAIDISLFNREAAKKFHAMKAKNQGRSARVRMNLFPDMDLVINWRDAARIENTNSVSWSGIVEGQPLSEAVLVVSGDSVTGNIASNGVIYQIRPGEQGEHFIREMDPAGFVREGEPKRTAAEGFVDPRAVNENAAADDSGTIIDVLVVYTPAARQGAGSEAKMLQLIQLGIAETNQGYANSGVKHRVRLAGTSEVNYKETGDMDTDLTRLTETSDGYIDDVHAMRDRAGADLVSLWIETGDACGLAWLLGSPSSPVANHGFSVVKRDCATGYYSFGHEMGHNLGAMHAPEDSKDDGAFPYSHGFKQVVTKPYWRSVMAYDCPGGCDRINYWSSPEVNYRGTQAGAAGKNDNRTTLNNTAAIVAGYRRSAQVGGSTPPPAQAPQGALPESTHPYADNTDRTWTYTASGNPQAVSVTFDKDTYVEEDWDYLVIMDGNGRQIPGSPFTGSALAGKSVTVPGATVRIRLISDESETFYGFKVTGITAASAGKVDLVAVSLTGPTTGTIGGRLSGVISKVANQGQAAAGPFRIAYYWVSASKEATFSGWSCGVNSLNAGATYTCSGDIGVSSTLAAGTYSLVVVADDQRQSGDANWDNNAILSEAGTITLR